MLGIYIAFRILAELPHIVSHSRIQSEARSINGPTLETGKGGPGWRRNSSKVMHFANRPPTWVMCFHSATSPLLRYPQNPRSG